MSVVLTEVSSTISIEQSVILHNVSWQTYEQLMKDHENQSVPRFTYQNGELEIFMPSEKHEETIRAIEAIVSTYIEEKDLDMRSLGSTTFKLESMQNGVEPDCCYYIQNIEKVKGVGKINLEKHPAPDLVVEVDITSPSINRFPIYAEFGVNEIWQYKKDEVKIFVLSGKEYLEKGESQALPKVTGKILTKFISESETEKRSAWVKNIRNWINENS